MCDEILKAVVPIFAGIGLGTVAGILGWCMGYVYHWLFDPYGRKAQTKDAKKRL